MAADPFFGFEVDVKELEAGIWTDFSDIIPGFQILLRSMESESFTNAQIEYALKIADNLDQKENRKALRDAQLHATADACILDWKGLPDKKSGKVVKHSKGMAYRFLTDRKYLQLTRKIDSEIGAISNNLPLLTEERVGNSEARS